MGKSKKRHSSSSSSSSEEDSSSSDESSDESDSSLTSSSSSSPSPEKKARKDSVSKKKKKENKKKKKKKSKKKKKKSFKFEIEKISSSDYYSRNSEFRAWIRSNDKIEKEFADMETKDAKSLFKKFVKKWNEKKLPKDFYRGSITSAGSGGSGGGKAAFQWGFAANMDAKTKSEIAVKKGNESEAGAGKKEKDVGREPSKLEKSLRQMAHGGSKNERDQNKPGGSNDAPKVIGPVMPAHIAQARESSSEDEQEAFERKMQEKRFKDYVKTTEEELCPKATGFEAKLEKKAMARERKRFRDTSPGLSDKVLLGDSNKMGKAIEKRKIDRAVKQEVSSTLAKQKLNDYAEREKNKMEALLEMAKANKKEGALW